MITTHDLIGLTWSFVYQNRIRHSSLYSHLNIDVILKKIFVSIEGQKTVIKNSLP